MKEFVPQVRQIWVHKPVAIVEVRTEHERVIPAASGVVGVHGALAVARGVALLELLSPPRRDVEIVGSNHNHVPATVVANGTHGVVGAHVAVRGSVAQVHPMLKASLAAIAEVRIEHERVMPVVFGVVGAPGVTAVAREAALQVL